MGRKNLLEDPTALDQTSKDLIRFDHSRRAFEKRLRELGDESEQYFRDVVQWMRAVVEKMAPELLTDQAE
jgi:hypothetical protein